ncbi:uncharacterized protein LOC130642223 [Hydractinia symbiolongicarpus]|uniref:uncharacterized protein LOC130642223 n=1 Tax=Hydractinia symbiolongicarpus TaxID=13093 RepID=UPI00254C6378|nr:uncharacterized protein LOC130642223 [Hydractinia symbiolongicarpus]
MLPLLSGFRKGYSSQHVLLHMMHDWHRGLDQGRYVAVVLKDLDKAFDCIDHELLLAKMHMNDLMLDFSDNHVSICNYADDNTLYASSTDITKVKQKLEKALVFVSEWFSNNGLQLNADKCQLIVFEKARFSLVLINFNGNILKECNNVKLFGVNFDNALSFTKHINALCKSASAKLSALRRISIFMSFDERSIIANLFVASETRYCPLIWSFTTRSSLARIERVHIRTLELCYDPTQERSVCKTMHRHYCDLLLREVFKTRNGLSPSYMQSVFPFKETPLYNLRRGCSIMRNRIVCLLVSASHIGSQLWDSLP